jgi:hypothetical protein
MSSYIQVSMRYMWPIEERPTYLQCLHLCFNIFAFAVGEASVSEPQFAKLFVLDVL